VLQQCFKGWVFEKTKKDEKARRLEITEKLCGILAVLTFLTNMPIQAEEGAADMVHTNATVIDTHNDTMMKVIDSSTWLPVTDIGSNTDFQLDIAKAQSGGLDVAFFAAFANHQADGENPAARTNSKVLALLNALHWTVSRNADRMVIGTSIATIEKGVRERKLVAVPAIEGAYSLETANAIELLHQYYDLGVRSIGIVWNHENSLGSGATGPDSMGLTDLGKKVMREMIRLGIMIDVSHMNERTFWDTLELTTVPVIASHSSAYSVRAHVRNLTDTQLIALKENGGIAQVNFWNTVLTDPGERADIAKLADHIDYVAKLIGVDHVGLGSDFDGADMPVGMENVSKLPKLTEELMTRGYPDRDIVKILGGNTLRVIREVQKNAGHTASEDREIVIKPTMNMGIMIDDASPHLLAQVKKKNGYEIDESGFRAIIDGIVHEPYYDSDTGLISLYAESLLAGGNFHVVTFEAKSGSGTITRETVIFYIR
jgi:membrane dipeptidase